MTTPTITLLVPSFSIVSDNGIKSLQFDVNLGANLGSASTSRLEALSFEMRVSGFPTTGFTVPSDQSTWFTNPNLSLLPGLQNFSSDIQFTQTVPGVLNLNWGWYTATGTTPQVDNKLFTVKIPLGSGDNLSQSIFKLEALTPIEAVFETGATGFEVDTLATLNTGPNPTALNYSDLYVAPKLTSITSKVGGVTAADGSDTDTALDVKANQDIEVTFTFSKSIDPNSFNFSDLEFNQMMEQGSLTAVSGSNNTAFKATFNPTDMNTWNGSVGIKTGASITGANNLPLDMTSMPASLQFAGDTAAPMTPSVQLDDIGVPGAGGGLSTDSVVNKVVLRSTGADYMNTQTINYYVDGASSPTASVSGSTTMGTGTTLNLADGVHTVRAQAVDTAGNVSEMSTAINFTVDTKAPMVSLVESASSIPGLATLPVGQYFHVQFSENVIQVNPNDFRVLNADGSVNSMATISSVYQGESGSMGDSWTPENDYYVVVNPLGQTNLSVGVVPVVNIIATTAYSGTPAGAAQLDSATQAMLTGGTWVKFDLNNPVTSLPTSPGWLTATSTQVDVTAPWIAATVQETPQSFYAYVKSTAAATALDASKLSFTLQSNYAGGDIGPQPFGASITDIAGNSFLSDPMIDDQFVINSSTPTLASNPIFVARPETGVGGFDSLDLSALSSAQPIDVFADYGQIIVQGQTSADTKVYRFEDFDEFVINNAGGVNFRGSMDASEVVQLKVASSNDIRLANKPDQSSETDIVDYSATSDAVTVNLGSTTNGGDGWFYATATKGMLGVGGVDKIAGAEGIFGSTANDTITGGLRDNLLVGGLGNDTLDGAAGNDILVGGAGSGDILIGGTGKDILIDLDGATLRGGTTKKNQSASGDQDVFVVRNGSTIENFHVARDGAGLAGRAAASANDTILFNLSLGTLTTNLGDLKTAVDTNQLSASQLQTALAEIKRDIDIRVERTAADSDDWAVIASYNGQWLAANQGSSVELARVIVKDMDASAMPASSVLTDVALPDFSLDNAVSDKIDQLVFSQVSDLLVDDQAINLAVALESVRQGTVRESKNGLMFGDFNLAERIFNPGAGSEKIFGSKGKDTYEFLVQDLRSANGSSTSDAGMDSIMDTGGDDAVAFSNISLSQLNQLDFTAVQLGRESGNYSLRSNYSQTDGTITNTGGFTWTGHFREGFGMELEKITLGNTTLEMADVRYRYDEEGNLLSWTPNQVASSGKDTIMVGGAGRSADASTFVVEKDAAFNTGIGADNKQNLFLWDADASDVIDLKAFFADATTARNAVQDTAPATPRNSFTIDLNATQDLVLNFMDTTLTQESLEMMIARAYAA